MDQSLRHHVSISGRERENRYISAASKSFRAVTPAWEVYSVLVTGQERRRFLRAVSRFYDHRYGNVGIIAGARAGIARRRFACVPVSFNRYSMGLQPDEVLRGMDLFKLKSSWRTLLLGTGVRPRRRKNAVTRFCFNRRRHRSRFETSSRAASVGKVPGFLRRFGTTRSPGWKMVDTRLINPADRPSSKRNYGNPIPAKFLPR